jgi:hypothetical protein
LVLAFGLFLLPFLSSSLPPHLFPFVATRCSNLDIFGLLGFS